MENFGGSKVALFFGEKLVVFLRDNKPNIPNANMWDFFGGGREGEETPTECAMREIDEELGIALAPERFIWTKSFPSLRDPNIASYFLVAHLTGGEVENIVLTEGQRWELMDVATFLEREDAVEGMKLRLSDYLERKIINPIL